MDLQNGMGNFQSGRWDVMCVCVCVFGPIIQLIYNLCVCIINILAYIHFTKRWFSTRTIKTHTIKNKNKNKKNKRYERK